jgi:hypothetical protein
VAGAGFEPAQAEPTRLQIAVNVVLTCNQTQLLFSDPVLIAGVATTKFELHTTALVYSASLASLPRQQPASCCSAPARSPPGRPGVQSCHRARALDGRARSSWTQRTMIRQRRSSPPAGERPNNQDPLGSGSSDSAGRAVLHGQAGNSAARSIPEQNHARAYCLIERRRSHHGLVLLMFHPLETVQARQRNDPVRV